MKLTSITLLPAVYGLASLAQTTTLGIGHGVANYTDGHADNAVWVLGDDPCDYIYMGVYGEDMCELNDGWFTAPDGCSYHFTGCGTGIGNFCLSNADGSIKSCPDWNREIHAAEGCSGPAGSYYVDRYFIF
ncbi:hypothetical protein J7T55_015146 [Diaporthe amygdali]|uniref:uncharacterized protein n=1 Tax=Phomopsis amygdali TaxID=1214568 RepID=UPI0022FDD629|nr:uncharacterized protein J7T55_015146 [Diaporthe amygdali]KAJ0120419.1 hypothetical protein J7T55_015146 [Diaporthe amygdali]